MVNSEWKETTVGKFAPFLYGKALPDKTRDSAGSVPVYGSNGIVGRHSQSFLTGPAIIIGRKGTVGAVNYSFEPCWPIDTTFYVGESSERDLRFTYYLLKSLGLEKMNGDSAVPGLNRDTAHLQKIFIPHIDEQRRIAHVLGTLDDKIELNRQLNATLEQLARTLFQSWFVDFDPVRAKASGEPEESICGRLGLTPELLALFPAALKDSMMGETPVGWEVKPFTDFIEILGGGTPKTSVSEYWNGIIPWFSVVDAPSETDIFAIATEKKISQAGLDNSSTRLLPQYTTIISARGTVGRLALIGCPMTMNQSCYGIVGRGFGPFFIYFATRELLNVLKKSSHGTVFDTITRDTFYSVRLPMPSKTVAVAFEDTIRILLQRVQQNCEESRTLRNLRDELLPKLLSGELRIAHEYDEAATGRV